MREYWTDDLGKKWRVPKPGRLNFWNPGAAALRAYVFRRDGFRCIKCGWEPPEKPGDYDGRYTVIGPDVNGKRRELQLDHVIARANGGTNRPGNLQTLCFGCNAGKCAR